jgi:hypothetical protein
MTTTALEDGHRTLYHWQPFDEARIRPLLEHNKLYCSRPNDFNDPWDCKPFFNTDVLNHPIELNHHITWAIDLCRNRTRMSEADIAHMAHTLANDPSKATEIIGQLSIDLGHAISQKHRIYCLGPDVNSQLMWSHYANKHKGICLQYDIRNTVMCAALKCSYTATFPLTKAYDNSEESDLQLLLTKSDAWSYEKEYRLITTERDFANDPDLLISINGMIDLPDGTLKAIIVGCEGDFDNIQKFVKAINPVLEVKRAIRIPNKYELTVA